MATKRKTALVTGSSRGIGRGIAWVLAEDGYDIAVNHHADTEAAQITIAGLMERGAAHSEFDLDLSQPENPAKLIDLVLEHFGEIDLLVNNAGVTTMKPIEQMLPEDVDFIYHLNFRAPYMATQRIIPHMKKRGSGNIINITSVHQSSGFLGSSIYGSMKAALKKFTEAIAVEVGYFGIRINSIAPGTINAKGPERVIPQERLKNIPLGRVGLPKDIGDAVRWLASEQASYITGQSIYVDGGLTIARSYTKDQRVRYGLEPEDE